MEQRYLSYITNPLSMLNLKMSPIDVCHYVDVANACNNNATIQPPITVVDDVQRYLKSYICTSFPSSSYDA